MTSSWKLSKWQLPVQPVSEISSKWWHPRISDVPANTRRNNNVIITSKRRRDVVSTKWWRYLSLCHMSVWVILHSKFSLAFALFISVLLSVHIYIHQHVLYKQTLLNDEWVSSLWHWYSFGLEWSYVIHCYPSAGRYVMMMSSNFPRILALCWGNSPTTGEFHSQRPVTRSFGVFFDPHLNKRLSKLSRRRWFETPSRSLWRHCNA